MYTIQSFGPDSSFWNLSAGGGEISPSDFLLTFYSPNRIEVSIPKFNAAAIFFGNFEYPGLIQTPADVTGLITKSEFYIGNQLVQLQTWSAGADVTKIGDYQYELSLLSGDDVAIGSNQNFNDGDGFWGLAGNDRFKGYGDDPYGDRFYGGSGIDTSIYQGKLSEYLITSSNRIWSGPYEEDLDMFGFIVEDIISNRDGLDSLVEVERLEFEQSDANGVNRVALDIGPAENAGSLYMLYKAAFNRAPDTEGMGYWLAQVDGGKNIVTDIAAGFVKAPEFVAKYGTNPTNAFYVDQLYLNVLGRAGEAGGVAYWNAELNAGNRSKAEVLVQFATLPEGASLVADLITNGIPYEEWVG